jgi:hypothetical protein
MKKNNIFTKLLKKIPKEEVLYNRKQMKIATILFGEILTPSSFLTRKERIKL